MKKILAFTLALAMVLSTMTTTFAASKEVEALANLKLLLNTTDAEVNAELNRAVGLAMVLKALGYTQADADAKAADNKFVDMEGASWAKGFATLGEELKLTNGVSVEPKLFAPADKLSKQAFVTFMLRALGYDSNDAWAKAGELAKEAKLVDEATLEDASFTKGEAAVVMYNALKATVQGDAKNRSLAQKLVDEGKLDKELAVANELISGEPEKLEVAGVKADNLREAVVTFNGTVDKTTAEKVGNYKVTGKTFGAAKLLEDGKTVVLTLSGSTFFENNKAVKLVVNGVKNVAGVAMSKQDVTFTPKDTEYPVVKDVVFTGPKALEITFSEPIQDFITIKVALKAGNSTLSATAKLSESNEKVLEVTTFSALKDGTEYLVSVGDPKSSSSYAKDYANYPNVYFEGTYTYNADKTAPEATVVKADQKVVAVEFNKPVSGLTVKHFYHSFAAYTAKAIYSKSDLKDGNKIDKTKAYSKVWVEFYKAKGDNPLPAGNVQLTILGEADKVKIQDNWKNAFATTSYDLTIVADREAPEVVTAEVTGEKEIKVTFNEAISNINRDRFTLLDKDGKEVEKGSKMTVERADSDKVAVLKLSESYAGKTLTLQVKGIKDASLYENMMSDYTTTIEFTDKTWKAPKDEAAELKREGDRPDNYKFFLYLTYEEDMDDSALNLDNYKLEVNGKTAKIKGSADFFEGKANIVVFELSYDKTKTDGSTDASFLAENNDTPITGAKLLINNAVKDLAGNVSSAFQTPVNIKKFEPKDGAPQIKTVEAVETKKIVVKFDKDLTSVDTSEFKLEPETYHKNASWNVVDGKTLEIYLADDAAMATGDMGVSLNFKVNKNTYDVYGRYLGATDTVSLGDTVTKSVVDKIAPTVAALKYSSTATEGAFSAYESGLTNVESQDGAPRIKVSKDSHNKYWVEVMYTEDMLQESFANTTFTVNNGLKVEGRPVVTGKTVKFEVTKTDLKWTDLEDLAITQVGSVKDAEENVFAGNSNSLETLNTVPKF